MREHYQIKHDAQSDEYAAWHFEQQENGSWCVVGIYQLATRSTPRRIKKFVRDHFGFSGQFSTKPPQETNK